MGMGGVGKFRNFLSALRPNLLFVSCEILVGGRKYPVGFWYLGRSVGLVCNFRAGGSAKKRICDGEAG